MRSKNTLLFFFEIFCFLFLGLGASAQESSRLLRWAADVESGAPYVFRDPAQPEKLKGFEYEIIERIAEKMHRKPQFIQNSWEGLIPGLSRGDYDVAINGIEITEDRKKEVLFSDPYFATGLQIVVRSEDAPIERLSDLTGLKVGTLSGALSERILKAQPGVTVLLYDSEALAHQDLLLKRSQALLFDAPIVKYYSEVNTRFRVSSTLLGHLQYGIVAAKKNAALVQEINRALAELQNSGELRKIYDRWALWNPQAAALLSDSTVSRTPPLEFEKFKSSLNAGRGWSERLAIYKNSLPSLGAAAWMTLKLSSLAMIFAIAFGLGLMALRVSKSRWLSSPALVVIELLRGTPLLLQLFLLFYALPSFGVELSPFWAAILGLGLNYSAQEAEIYRAGLKAVHPHQLEAAQVLGLSGWQSFWLVQAPQALRICLPPMTTDFIALIKDSSLVSVITLVELTKMSSTLSSTYYDYLGFGLLAALFYLVIGLPFVLISKYLEKHKLQMS